MKLMLSLGVCHPSSKMIPLFFCVCVYQFLDPTNYNNFLYHLFYNDVSVFPIERIGSGAV